MSRSPCAPSTMRCVARSRRSLTSATIASTSAIRAAPPAARATMPVVVVRSSTAAEDNPGPGRPSAGEERRVLLLVVVGRLLALDRRDGHGDGHRRADRRAAREGDLDVRRLAGGRLGDDLLRVDGRAGAGDAQRHGDVALVVLALVLGLD